MHPTRRLARRVPRRIPVVLPLLCAALVAGACGGRSGDVAPVATDAGPTIVAPPSGGLTITDVWAPASPGAVSTGAVYLTVANSGDADDQLIAAYSDRAGAVEIHQTTNEGGMVGMAKVDAVPVPAGGSATLAPGGTHVMLIDLTAPLTAGERFPVTLSFARAGVMTVDAEVRAAP